MASAIENILLSVPPAKHQRVAEIPGRKYGNHRHLLAPQLFQHPGYFGIAVGPIGPHLHDAVGLNGLLTRLLRRTAFSNALQLRHQSAVKSTSTVWFAVSRSSLSREKRSLRPVQTLLHVIGQAAKGDSLREQPAGPAKGNHPNQARKGDRLNPRTGPSAPLRQRRDPANPPAETQTPNISATVGTTAAKGMKLSRYTTVAMSTKPITCLKVSIQRPASAGSRSTPGTHRRADKGWPCRAPRDEHRIRVERRLRDHPGERGGQYRGAARSGQDRGQHALGKGPGGPFLPGGLAGPSAPHKAGQRNLPHPQQAQPKPPRSRPSPR